MIATGRSTGSGSYCGCLRISTRRAPQQQGNLTVGLRVFRQIVVDDERVAAVVAEELPERARGVRADVKEWRRIRRRRRDDDRVAHRVGFFERANHLRDGGLFLSN